jgi:acyl transferase domain-containing protein
MWFPGPWLRAHTYLAIRLAGFPSDALKGTRTAVLSASWTEDYIRMNALDPENVDRTTATGSMASIIPNRVSYYFGLQGPSFHVDTACSSGLSALDIACKLLASGDADAVSGVSL